MTATFNPLQLADIASDQWGLVTASQARAVGGTAQRLARMTAAGTLERLRYGVYRLAGSPPHPQEQLRAAWLVLDPTRTATRRLEEDRQPDVVSHRSAARLHQLGNVDADVMEFTVPDRRQSRLSDLRFHRATLTEDQWTQVDGLPVTTVLTTVQQLAHAHIDGGHLAGVIRDALTTGKAEVGQIIQVLRPYAHQYGAILGDATGFVAQLMEDAGIPQSALEVAALTQVAHDRRRGSLAVQSQARDQIDVDIEQSAARFNAKSDHAQALWSSVNGSIHSAEMRKAMDNIAAIGRSPELQKAVANFTSVSRNPELTRMIAGITAMTHNPELTQMMAGITAISRSPELQKAVANITSVSRNAELAQMMAEISAMTRNPGLDKAIASLTSAIRNPALSQMMNSITATNRSPEMQRAIANLTSVSRNREAQGALTTATEALDSSALRPARKRSIAADRGQKQLPRGSATSQTAKQTVGDATENSNSTDATPYKDAR